MKRRDEGKASLVEFLRSIKFAHENRVAHESHFECPTEFAHFKPSAGAGSEASVEDSQLIRSAN